MATLYMSTYLRLHQINRLRASSVIAVLVQTVLKNSVKAVVNLVSIDRSQSNAGHQANESNQQQ